MIRDTMSPTAKEILEATGKIEVVVDNDKTTNDPAALAKIIGDFDGLAVRSGTRVTEGRIASCAAPEGHRPGGHRGG